VGRRQELHAGPHLHVGADRDGFGNGYDATLTSKSF
jgi:hypothetical protein